MTMTDAELAEIRARAEAATRGPWQSIDITDEDDDFCGYWTITKPGETGVDRWLIDDMETLTGQDMADADFVAHARTDVPALCDEVEALRGELARAREALEAAIPLLQTHSCWHDVFPELDCCEYGLVAEQASVALGNEPLPIYAEHMAVLRDAGRGEGE